jgi:DNA-binding transcriptional regulator YiaG
MESHMSSLVKAVRQIVPRAGERNVHLVINESLGIRIRTLREAAAVTQTDLAWAIGVTHAAVSAWETGDSLNLKLQTFLRILDVLGVAEPEYLIRGTDW